MRTLPTTVLTYRLSLQQFVVYGPLDVQLWLWLWIYKHAFCRNDDEMATSRTASRSS
jgi:hypothetical protein